MKNIPTSIEEDRQNNENNQQQQHKKCPIKAIINSPDIFLKCPTTQEGKEGIWGQYQGGSGVTIIPQNKTKRYEKKYFITKKI